MIGCGINTVTKLLVALGTACGIYHTVVSASTAAMVIGLHIPNKLPFDPLKDYEFISLFDVTLNILVINPSLP